MPPIRLGAAEPLRSFARLSIRAAVFLGFGAIFGLWLLASYQLSLRISEAQSRTAEINSRYVNAQETLAGIRAQVLIASVAFRDALLDPRGESIQGYRQRLDEAYDALDRLLASYELVVESAAEREQFARLKSEVAAYRTTTLEVLGSDRSRWLLEARELLSLRVTPRRDALIAVSERVQTLNQAGYVERQAEVAGIYRTVQREIWRLLGVALAIGIAVAALAVAYAGRLERRLQRQTAKESALRRELQDLSARLVNVQEQERRQIARELHDEIGQALTAIKVELACAERTIEFATGPTTVLHDARVITDGALHQVRDLSYLLHPAVLDELGLVPAVESYTKSFGRRHDVKVTMVHDGTIARLSPDVEAAAYRIIQEALTNVARHAHAASCHVAIVRLPGTLRIVIGDDGVGFDAARGRDADRKGLGLVGIRERVSHLHGTVSIESDAGRGTRLIVELPLVEARGGPEFVALDSAVATG